MKESAFNRIANRIPEPIKAQIGWQIDIAEKIAAYQKRNNLSDEKLQKLLNIDQKKLRQWLSGRYSFDENEINILSNAFGENLPSKPF